VALQRSPSKSTRKAAAQLGISRRSVQILKGDLNLYPYKMAVLPKLTVQNKQSMAFAEWAKNNEVSFNNFLAF
jgi:5-bromo-4-chloroindolyl phosphate hydrolysis protein